MSVSQGKELSILVYTSLFSGRDYLYTITADIEAWHHSARTNGGYWDSGFSIRGGQSDQEEWLTDGVGRHIVMLNESLEVIWEGFVDSVQTTSGSLALRTTNMTDIANKVKMKYSSSYEDTNYMAQTHDTDWAEDLDSQAKYGILEKILTASNCSLEEAEFLRDRYLQENSWPRIIPDIGTSRQEPNIIVECKGYAWLMRNYYYNQTCESGDVTVQQKIRSLFLADPNNLYDTDEVKQTTDLIVNGNFEVLGAGGADIWAGWTETAGTGTVANVTTDHKEGSQCCSLTAGASTDTLVYQDVTVEAGKAYKVSFHSRDLSQDTVTGTHSGGNNESSLTDSTGDFVEDGVKVGQYIANQTDSSTAKITRVQKTNISGTLVEDVIGSGADEDWDNGDAYEVVTGAFPARYYIYDVTNGAYIRSLSNTSDHGNLSWKRTDVVLYAPTGCTSIRVGLQCAATDAKQVYFDAVSFRELDVAMAEHNTYVHAWEEEDESAWSVLQDTLQYGDPDGNQFFCGVYEGRHVRFEMMDETPFYYYRAGEPGRGYETVDGQKVEDWNVRPGKWLIFPDLLIGRVDDGVDIRENPRAALIEEVRFSAKLGLTVNFGDVATYESQLARLGLKGV